MMRAWRLVYVAACLGLVLGTSFVRQAAAAEPDVWQRDYFAAYAQAEQEKKLLFVYFHSANEQRACDAFESETLADPKVRKLLQPLICVRVPVDEVVTLEGAESKLLDHAAFVEMRSRPGLALIDLAHPEAPYYARVVSLLPFSPGLYVSPFGMTTLLGLPSGTLTQRTLTYAVRVHPEGPQSTGGEMLPVLAAEAEVAAIYQAQLNVQGHHNWGTRFHRINAQLPAGHLSQEVCAESWPGQTMLESAHELVHSWRQSSGHWAAVSGKQPYFGYDMKQGSGGIWYGVGIFGNSGS